MGKLRTDLIEWDIKKAFDNLLPVEGLSCFSHDVILLEIVLMAQLLKAGTFLEKSHFGIGGEDL